MKDRLNVLSEDPHDQKLLSQVHPSSWNNPYPAPRYNLVVVGAGTAGLVAAVGGANLGARVALVERQFLGGDCLNFGCVPSKAILRPTRVVGEILASNDLGLNISLDDLDIDFSKVMERMRRLRAGISSHDSVERMQSLGIDVFLGEAQFVGQKSLKVGTDTLNFKKAVIATGARPAVPPIPGLSAAGFFTNESVFTLTERPETLVVIGGGPIGCELSQAFNRLGVKVTLIQRNVQFLPREDRDAAQLLFEVFKRENINCFLGAHIEKVTKRAGKKVLQLITEGKKSAIEADEILVGTGRIPNVEGLNLQAAGVAYDKKGIKVNSFLQTTNRCIYAAGDVCLDLKFTHMAEAAARIVIQNALFLKSKRIKSLIVPRCTYTDPEIAQVGLAVKEAEEKDLHVETYIHSFQKVDRAILDGEEEGYVKFLVKKGKDKILGATVVAKHAGEMISEITLAMVSGKGLKTLVNVIHPYPTQSEAFKRAAELYYAHKFKPFFQRILRRWFVWKRRGS